MNYPTHNMLREMKLLLMKACRTATEEKRFQLLLNQSENYFGWVLRLIVQTKIGRQVKFEITEDSQQEIKVLFLEYINENEFADKTMYEDYHPTWLKHHLIFPLLKKEVAQRGGEMKRNGEGKWYARLPSHREMEQMYLIIEQEIDLNKNLIESINALEDKTQREILRSIWSEGLTRDEVCAKLGVTKWRYDQTTKIAKEL